MVESESKNFWQELKRDQLKWLVAGVFVFAFMLRMYYFFITVRQALWWDEAEYLVLAKHLALGTPLTGWAAFRPVLYSLVAAVFYKIGLGETTLRLVMVLISVASVVLMYYVGKEMYNAHVGLISAALMSAFYLSLFYTARLLVDVPSLALGLLIVFLFWKYYVKSYNARFIWLLVPLAMLGFLLRFTTMLFIMVPFVFLLFYKRLSLFMDKNLWISLGIGVLVSLPYFIWAQVTKGNAFYAIFVAGGEGAKITLSQGFSQLWQYVAFMPQYLHWVLLVLFIIGLYIFVDIFVGFDLMLKNKDSKQWRNFFILLLLIIPLIYFAFYTNHFEDRYVLPCFSAIFILVAQGALIAKVHIEKYLKDKSKVVAAVVIVLLVIIGIGQLWYHSDNIIKAKLDSYSQVRAAGLWLKGQGNTAPVFSTSVPMITYYAEVETYGYPATQEAFEGQAKELNAKYMIISVFEQAPEWVYEYQKDTSKVQLVNIYFLDEAKQQPVLVIYGIK